MPKRRPAENGQKLPVTNGGYGQKQPIGINTVVCPRFVGFQVLTAQKPHVLLNTRDHRSEGMEPQLDGKHLPPPSYRSLASSCGPCSPAGYQT